MRRAVRHLCQRLRNWRNRAALEARVAGWTPPASLIHFNAEPLLSTERALGNLNTAWADLHRAMHRSVPAEQLRAVQHTHRQAVQVYVAAALREFGQ